MVKARYKLIRFLFWVGGIVLLCQSCVEPFTPETEVYEKAIVIEGRVLEGKTSSIVKISRTFTFEEKEPELIRNAQVRIFDDLGITYPLSEQPQGFYESDTNQLVGIPGRSYQLEVKTSDGELYQSDWKKMKKGAPIVEVMADFEEKIVGFDTLTGMQVYLSTEDPENDTRYYQWEYHETWIYRVPYPATGVWDLNTSSPIIDLDSLPWDCYGSVKGAEVLIGTSLGLDKDVIIDQEIKYIDTRTNRLRQRYSMLIKQYSIDEETYAFWKNVQTINEDPGTLFDPIPTEVLGNIVNTNDPDIPVLGYFSADGFSSKRIFIDRLDFTPSVYVPSEYEGCDFFVFETQAEMSQHIRAGGVFVAILTDFSGNITGYSGSYLNCADCRVVNNGSTRIPKFWR